MIDRFNARRMVKKGSLRADMFADAFPFVHPWTRLRYVHSGHPQAGLGLGEDPDKPAKTLASLLGTTGLVQNDDTILVAPGHTESVTIADGLKIPSTLKRVQILGLGVGNERPAFAFGTVTGADFMIEGVGCHVHNCSFVAGLAGLAACVNIAASSTRFTNCRFSTLAVAPVTLLTCGLSGSYGEIFIDDCTFETLTTARSAIDLSTGTLSNVYIHNCRVVGDFQEAAANTAACIRNSGVAVSNLNVQDCYLKNTSASASDQVCIRADAATTGDLRRVNCANAQGDGAQVAVVAAAMHWDQITINNAPAENGMKALTAAGHTYHGAAGGLT